MTARHHTSKLSAGRHHGPQDGACVMELASILAGEPFTDHPASVCPVIAAFLRSYNDHVDDRRRQDLYPYAARALGSGPDPAAERRHAQLCLRWARANCRPPPLHVRVLHRLLRWQGPDVDGVYAARAAARTPGAHRHVLDFLVELIATEPPSIAAQQGATPAPTGRTRAGKSWPATMAAWGIKTSVVTASLVLAAAASASARAPFERGILLKGTVVTMDRQFRVIRHAKVLVRGQRIIAVWSHRPAPQGIRAGRAVVVAPRDALIFPGLINLHDHPSWSVLPPWPPPSSDSQPAFGRPTGHEPYANRYQWNGAAGFDDSPPEERRLIVAPHDVLTSGLGLTAETTKWAELRELLGGATSEQGAGPDPATDDLLARDVDNVNFGHDRVETNTFPGLDPGLVARERAGLVDAYIIHLAEGVPDQDRRPGDTYSSRAEFATLRADHLLNDETVIIHGTALQPADFAAMRAARSPRANGTGDGLGAKLVWSPLSNLLLYGHTTNVYQALAAGVTVSLGTDWSPSGSGNLLEELKIADIALHNRSLLGRFRQLVPSLHTEKALDRELVAMVTSNPARTLRWTRYVGSVAPGKLADLTVITRPHGPPRRRPRSVYRSLIDSTDQDVRLTMVGGDPLTGDVNLMRALKGKDFETIHSARLGFVKAIDVTKPGVPKGEETFADIQATLSAAVHALGGADGYAYLKAHVLGGALASLPDQQFRADYLVPTFGTTAEGQLNAESIAPSPILPEDDQFRFDEIEGRRDPSGAIADPKPPFGLYATNVNQKPLGVANPFASFESRWYPRPKRHRGPRIVARSRTVASQQRAQSAM